MELIVITPEIDREDEIYWIEALFNHGLDRLHVRKPGYTPNKWKHYLDRLTGSYSSGISLHHCPSLVHNYGMGLHVSFSSFQENNYACTPLSVSVHTANEFKAVDGKCDYAFISPVWNSISKKDYMQNKELHGLGKQARKSKLFALGGVSSDNIVQTQALGFDGAAILGFIWNRKSPLKAFQELANLLKQTEDANAKTICN